MRASARNFVLRESLPGAIFLCLALFSIVKSLYLPGCLAFDINDDRNHTFANLLAARLILENGELPQMNFFNNFGTPILGDAVTYPFAVQAITYRFLPPALAMTVNRAVLAFLTMLALYALYRLFFGRFASTLAALFCYFTPGFSWHAAHHHYQAAQLYFSILLILAVLGGRGKIRPLAYGLGCFAAATLFVLGASINVVAAALPLVLAACPFLAQKNRLRFTARTALALAGALVATAPQTLAFAQEIAASVRLGAPYARAMETGWRAAVLGVLDASCLPPDMSLFFSLPVLAAGIMGGAGLMKNADSRPLGLASVALGLVPVPLVLLLVALPGAWSAIPLVKSTNVTRLWWLTNVFFGFGVAGFAARLLKEGFPRSWHAAAALATAAALAAIRLLGAWDMAGRACKAGMILFLVFTVLGAARRKIPGKPLPAAPVRAFKAVAACVFLAAYILPFQIIRMELDKPGKCLCNNAFAPTIWSEFFPPGFLSFMEPFHRMASSLPSSTGCDLTAIFGRVLGSNGRSIIARQDFFDALKSQGLVVNDDRLSGYHFAPPWRMEKLRLLGIRYLLATEVRLDPDAYGQGLGRTGFNRPRLYEDPALPTPFYLMREGSPEPEFVRDYHFTGNTAVARLPAGARGDLVGTFTDRPGWEIFVDGRPVAHRGDGFLFLRAAVTPLDREVRFSFAPVTWTRAGVFFLAGLGLALGAGGAGRVQGFRKVNSAV